MMYDYGWGAGQWIMMAIGMIAFWGLVIAAIVVAVRATGRRDTQPPYQRPGPDRAEQILAERYARGEIDEAEYAHHRDLLRSGR